MLAEVIEPRPDLLLLGTVPGGTTETPVGAILGHDLVDALLVSIKIIVGTETVNLRASGYVAFEWFLMSEHMLSDTLLLTEKGLWWFGHQPTCVPTGSWR